ALERHLADTNLLVDHPSAGLCRFALLDLADIREFGTRSIAALVNEDCRRNGLGCWMSASLKWVDWMGRKIEKVRPCRNASIQRRRINMIARRGGMSGFLILTTWG